MILADTMLTGVIDEEYVDVDRKHRGSALNYDLYDYTEGCILIQRRHTTCTKYGNSPQKDYFLLVRKGGDIAIVPAPHKMAIARAAKLDPPIGHIISKITGCNEAKEVLGKFAN